MNKEQRRKRRKQRNERRKEPAKPHVGSWDVEYECGLHILAEPTHQDEIEAKVAKLKHSCRRRNCRAWRYIRITQDNIDKFGWGDNDGGGLDTNTRELARKPGKVRA